MNNQNEGTRREMGQLITLVWSGDRLADCLRRRGYETLEDAVRHLQAFVPQGMTLTRQHLDNWVSNRNVPSMRYLPALRYGLGIEDPVTELFEPVRPNA